MPVELSGVCPMCKIAKYSICEAFKLAQTVGKGFEDLGLGIKQDYVEKGGLDDLTFPGCPHVDEIKRRFVEGTLGNEEP